MDAVLAFFHRTRKLSISQNDVTCNIRYSTLFWLFIIGSIAGYVLEGLWCILTKGHWEHHSATVWGPFCIIYGVGAVAVYLFSTFLKDKNLLIRLAVFTISGATVEYLGSVFQELCLGSISWNYSEHIFNLGGRVSLKMALLWGVLGILFMQFLFPPINRLFEKMKGKGWKIACMVTTVFMTVNLLVTAAAVIRWRTRVEAPETADPAVQWLDNTYNDQTMEKLFPNMQFTK